MSVDELSWDVNINFNEYLRHY